MVSVGMPVYNGEAHIRKAIESILGQTFTDFELVISDNASSDGTAAICQEYAARDSRIRIFRNEINRGSVYNDNRVFQLSRGKYFKWASSNDYIAPTMLEECVNVLDRRPEVVLCYSHSCLLDDQGALIEEHEDALDLENDSPSFRFRRITCDMGLNNAFSGLIRSDVLRQTTYLENYLASDLPVMAELALHGKFHEIPRPLFFRRVGNQSATVHKSIKELLVFHDPSSGKRRVMKCWRLNWEYLRAAHRVKIGLKERLKIYDLMVRFAYWNRDLLSQELRATLHV